MCACVVALVKKKLCPESLGFSRAGFSNLEGLTHQLYFCKRRRERENVCEEQSKREGGREGGKKGENQVGGDGDLD